METWKCDLVNMGNQAQLGKKPRARTSDANIICLALLRMILILFIYLYIYIVYVYIYINIYVSIIPIFLGKRNSQTEFLVLAVFHFHFLPIVGPYEGMQFFSDGNFVMEKLKICTQGQK
jgi:hypothetical protein